MRRPACLALDELYLALPPVNVRQLHADDIDGTQARGCAHKDDGAVPLPCLCLHVDYAEDPLQLLIGHVTLDGHPPVYLV